MASASSRTAKVHWSLEQAVFGLCLLGGLPAAIALVWILWGQNYSFEVRWTLAAVILVVWLGCASAAYQMVTRVLYLAANLLGALHEGDYSIRGTGAKPGSAADLVMKEINSLGNTLQRQRSEAVESTALLTSVMGAIDLIGVSELLISCERTRTIRCQASCCSSRSARLRSANTSS